MGTRMRTLGLGLTMIAGFTCVAFQNWNYIDIGRASIGPVNEKIRLSHARELLGKYYKGSFENEIESIADLNQQILDEVTERLPQVYKKNAPQVTQALIEQSEKHHLDPVFVMAIIETESQFNPKARGRFGEIGLMQIKPDTAAWIAKKNSMKFLGAKSLENPIQNLKLGIAYVSFLKNHFNDTPAKYLSAYNMGPGKLRRMMANNVKPKEYAVRVMGNYKDLCAVIKTSSRKAIDQASL